MVLGHPATVVAELLSDGEQVEGEAVGVCGVFADVQVGQESESHGATSRAICPNMVAGAAVAVDFSPRPRRPDRRSLGHEQRRSGHSSGPYPVSLVEVHTMRVFLAGASGAIGRPLTRMLV